MMDVIRITASFVSLFGGIIGFVWMIRQFDDILYRPKFNHPIWCFIFPTISVLFLFGMIFLAAWLGAPYGSAESASGIAKHTANKDPTVGIGLLVILLFVALAKAKDFGKKRK